MKYCPYCGASLPGSAVSFCPECGCALPKAGSAKQLQKRPPARQERAEAQPYSRKNANDGYDGYYDDVQPIDAGEDLGKMDPEMTKRVVLVIAGAVGIIAAAAVLMLLL